MKKSDHRTFKPAAIGKGFTLVELLIAVAIIAILATLLTAAVNRVLVRAREFEITSQITLLEQAVEQFQIQYNFYPPSFTEFQEIELSAGGSNAQIEAADRLLEFITRIAPNNQEGVGAPGNRPIDIWYQSVGQQIIATPGADMVFWLSGLAKNKQFPLTVANSSGRVGLPAYDAGDVERDVFFDFSNDQLTINGMVASFRQNTRSDQVFLYRDANNYFPRNFGGSSRIGGAYTYGDQRLLNALGSQENVERVLSEIAGHAPPTAPNITQEEFDAVYPNPNTFQIVTFGLDSQPGETEGANQIDKTLAAGADNIVNFGVGGPARLDAVLFEQ